MKSLIVITILVAALFSGGCAITVHDGITGQNTRYDPLWFISFDKSDVKHKRSKDDYKPEPPPELHQRLEAGKLPTEPILRLETGMHTSTIRRIDVDSKGEWLVTSSEDKTVRLWDLKNYQLTEPVRTYRVPSDDREDGKIYAVALSPDARLISAGGLTRLGSEKGYTIYIFDRITGQIIHSIKNLPASILHMEFSPDGTRLAASLHDSEGIRVFKSDDFSELFKDDSYGDASYGLAYSKDGRLATVSIDGYVRIYDSNHRRLVKKKMSGDKKSPCSVAFSPDGQKVAVGFFDHGADILFANTLERSQNLDYRGLYDEDSHDSVAFSADGRYLYAGSGYSVRGAKLPSITIRQWDLTNGSYREGVVADNTINQIKPLLNGDMVFGSASPSFGVIRKMGLVAFKEFYQYETRRSEIFSSDDGAVFYLDTAKEDSVPFSITARDFDQSKKAGLNPRNRKNGVYWEDYNSSNPKLIGVDVTLDEDERALSAVACRNDDCVLVGSSWHLTLVNGHGKTLWKTSTKAEPWAVTITKDTKVAIAAFSDGTFRWYRMNDGKEILSYFTSRKQSGDGREWVMWTPEGYFDASPGGAKMIGYHRNQGTSREATFMRSGEVL